MKLKVAAKVALFCQGKVLIVSDPEGKWDFPGGGIEGDEKLETALHRELQEELGLTEVTLDRVVHADEWFIPKKDLHVIAVFYQAEIDKAPMFVLSPEHARAEWINPEDLSQYDATDDTVRALEALQT
jgi:8-oxo-dGTP pyrophosphatase MutT (NUDIX family)